MSLADKLAQTYIEKSAISPEQAEARSDFERALRLERRLRNRAERAEERAELTKKPFSLTGLPADVADAMIPDIGLGMPLRLGAAGLGGRLGFELMRETPIGRMTGGDIERAIQRAWGAGGVTPEMQALRQELTGRARMGQPATLRRGPLAERVEQYLPQSLRRHLPEVVEGMTYTDYPPRPGFEQGGPGPRGGGGRQVTMQMSAAERRLLQEALEEGAMPRNAGFMRRFASKYLRGRQALGTLGGAGLGLAATGIPELIGNVVTRMRGGASSVRARAQAAQALRRAEELAEEREDLLASLQR